MMRYLVMEVHPAYAVVLDESGRFLKTANLNYQVGDEVTEVVEMNLPAKRSNNFYKSFAAFAVAAACFCLVFFGAYQPNFMAYGTLRIQINPDVQLTFSRTDRVLDVEGLNQDGIDLIQGYDYSGKSRDVVTDELVERAIEQGYLSGGGGVTISVSGGTVEWQHATEEDTRRYLQSHWGEKIVITIGTDESEPPGESTPPSSSVEIVIPSQPAPEESPSSPQASQSVPPAVEEDDDDDRDDRDDEPDDDDNDDVEPDDPDDDGVYSQSPDDDDKDDDEGDGGYSEAPDDDADDINDDDWDDDGPDDDNDDDT